MIAPARIISHVADSYGYSRIQLTADRRHKPVVQARFLAYWLCRQITGLSLPQIGNAFNRDHTTIMHGCVAAEYRLKHDPAYRVRCMDVLRRIEQSA